MIESYVKEGTGEEGNFFSGCSQESRQTKVTHMPCISDMLRMVWRPQRQRDGEGSLFLREP